MSAQPASQAVIKYQARGSEDFVQLLDSRGRVKAWIDSTGTLQQSDVLPNTPTEIDAGTF